MEVPSKKRKIDDTSSSSKDNGIELENGTSRDKKSTISLRKQYIAPSCEYYYPKDPLKIVRGEGAFLIDEHGVRYLDCVNNVCHVGHCNKKVVEAAAKQMSVLNTNTRYLNDNIVDYAQHLRSKMPGDLGIFYFTNSGSEANELALQLAHRTTGNKVVIAIDGAYHGHLTSLLEISSYKWKGDTKWCGENTVVAPFPDVLRGQYRDPHTAGKLYALQVKELIDKVHSSGRKISCFISESAMSCGGLRPFPKGYLKDVYQYVREAGGLCIADEVQVGFGRAGKCFWMFEDQDVIPDVVTMGKPMGNGHPVSAAVTTRAIAEKFKANSPSCYFNTYGGNPVSMAVANAVLNVIEEDKLQEHARAVGEYVFSKFEDLQKKYPNVIGFVHHCGLFGGIDLIKDCESCAPNTELAQLVHLRLKEKHHIIMTTDGLHDNVMKFKPPMVFDWKDADYLVECFDESLKALTAPPAPPAVNKEVLMTGRPTCSDPPAVAVSCLPVVKT